MDQDSRSRTPKIPPILIWAAIIGFFWFILHLGSNDQPGGSASPAAAKQPLEDMVKYQSEYEAMCSRLKVSNQVQSIAPYDASEPNCLGITIKGTMDDYDARKAALETYQLFVNVRSKCYPPDEAKDCVVVIYDDTHKALSTADMSGTHN